MASYGRLLLVATLAIAVTGCRKGDAPVKQDEHAAGLDGSWTATVTINGSAVPGLDTTIEIQGERLKRDRQLAYIQSNFGVKPEPEEGTYTLDKTASPPSIDITFPNGKKILGIYEIDGNSAKLAYFLRPGASRPTDFTTTRGGDMLVVYQMQK